MDYSKNKKIKKIENTNKDISDVKNKINVGNVKIKKESIGDKVHSRLTSQVNGKSLKEYIIQDVVMPTAKDMMWNMGSNMLSLLIYGNVKNAQQLKSKFSKIAYNNVSSITSIKTNSGGLLRNNVTNIGSQYSFKNIAFETASDGREVLDGLWDILEKYDFVTVGDFYDICGFQFSPTDQNYGWDRTGLTKCEVAYSQDGYYIKFPSVIVNQYRR